MRLSGAKADTNTLLLAAAVDRLGYLVWAKTKDAKNNRNKPKSIFDVVMGVLEKGNDIAAFSSAEEFEAARARILGVHNGD